MFAGVGYVLPHTGINPLAPGGSNGIKPKEMPPADEMGYPDPEAAEFGFLYRGGDDSHQAVSAVEWQHGLVQGKKLKCYLSPFSLSSLPPSPTKCILSPETC